MSDYLPNVDPTRHGDWIQTFSGRSFWPLDPRADEISIKDIAHALSMKCRYAGHTTRFYSVAEHSVLVSLHVPPEYALWGLLHDAAEAYSADIPRPIKRMMPGWKDMEASIMVAVCDHFGLPRQEPAEVKAVDLAITSDEREKLMAKGDRDWGSLPPPVGARVVGFLPDEAKLRFMHRYSDLIGAAP